MKTNYTLKVGDRVHFKTWEAMEKEFGLDEEGDINSRISFSKLLKQLCGASATVKSIEFGYIVMLENFEKDIQLANGFTAKDLVFCSDIFMPVSEVE